MEKLSRKTYYKPDENIIKKMKDTFYNCPSAVSYCRSLKIPEEVMNENIGILYDFARDVNYCKKSITINWFLSFIFSKSFLHGVSCLSKMPSS